MISDIPTLIFSPAIGLMNRMSFLRKFSMLGTITVLALFVVLYSLSNYLNQSIAHSRKELRGITLIKPVAEAIQLLQVHRGLSSGVLGGIHDLDNARAEKARTVEQAFNAIDTLVASGEQNLETWKKIKFDWKRIRDSGMDWSRAENFAGHTRLIDEMLQHEAVIADEFGLTSDPDLDTFYLIYTSNNEILRSLEHLGQIRAIGTGILGAKELSEQQAADMKTLLSLLSYTLKPLKLSLDKAMRYNPEMRQDLVTIYDNIDGSSRRIIDAVHADILDRRFSMQPAEFFAIATTAIDQGYAQLYKSLLPTVERLIEARVHRAEAILMLTVGIALLLMLLVAYFMAAIYFGTLNSIDTLSSSARGFVRGNLLDRVHLDTQDELSRVGDSFNRMADDLNELIRERHASERYTRTLIEVNPDALLVIDREGVITDANAAAEGLTGIRRSSLVGHRFAGRFTDEAVAESVFRRIFADERVIDAPLIIRPVFGRGADVLCNAGIYRGGVDHGVDGDEVIGAIVVLRDVTERKKAEEELRIAAIVFESAQGMAITDLQCKILRINPAFTRITGYPAALAIGQHTRLLSSGRHDARFYKTMWENIQRNGSWEGEIWNRRRSGELYPEYLTITAVKGNDGIVSNYVATLSDITELKAEADGTTWNLAFYDPLTHLPNRRMLQDRLTVALAASARSGHHGALLWLGLDNCDLDEASAEQLLLQITQRLTKGVREGDTAATLGNGEFVVMMSDLSEDDAEAMKQATTLGDKLVQTLGDRYSITEQVTNPGAELQVRTSIGITLFQGRALNADAVLSQGSSAMHQARAKASIPLDFIATNS